MIDSRRGRGEGEARRSSNSKQERDFNICKVTQADMTPVQTARAHIHTHSHLLAAMLEATHCGLHPNENIRFWPVCFEMFGMVRFYLSCQPEGHVNVCVCMMCVLSSGAE